MSVFVTGVPISKEANRKLKMREDDPRGATYSALRYSSASVLPISCERMYNIIPKSHNGLNQSFLRDALGIALVRT